MSTLAPSPLAAVHALLGRAARLLLGAALLLTATGLPAQAWEASTDGLLPVPPLSRRVTDLTQTLSPTEAAALEAKLADWEARTSNQLAVLIVPTTQPEPIESYALRVAEAWKIGRKGQDNGALFLVAKGDRRMRIEVGYGLEGTLTDVTARRIIAENVAPAFRENRYAAGIDAGVDRIIAVVGEGKPLLPPTPASRKGGGGGLGVDTLMLIVFVLAAVGGVLRRIFGRVLGSMVGGGIVGAVAWLFAGSIALAVVVAIVAFFLMIVFGMGGPMVRRGGGWTPTSGGWSGGGWSGGGGGGFSGGGGSFGGGGASGNW